MNRFQRMLERNSFSLIVSLTRNDVDLAKVAQDNGADAVKVHTCVAHQASGVRFGSLQEEASVFEVMRKALNIAMGIVPGVGVDLEWPEIKRMGDMGFDFFDAHISSISPLILDETRLAPMLSISPQHTIEEATVAASLPTVTCLEAGIVPHEGYGQRASLDDFVQYGVLASAVGKPVVVPTERRLLPEEVPVLAAFGVRAIMIGAVVTGMTAEGLARATRAFRDAIDGMSEQG